MYGNNTRSWITTMYSSRESLNRNYCVHVHVYESGVHNVILTVAVYQRELDSLQSITAWKIAQLLDSRKQLGLPSKNESSEKGKICLKGGELP